MLRSMMCILMAQERSKRMNRQREPRAMQWAFRVSGARCPRPQFRARAFSGDAPTALHNLGPHVPATSQLTRHCVPSNFLRNSLKTKKSDSRYSTQTDRAPSVHGEWSLGDRSYPRAQFARHTMASKFSRNSLKTKKSDTHCSTHKSPPTRTHFAPTNPSKLDAHSHENSRPARKRLAAARY